MDIRKLVFFGICLLTIGGLGATATGSPARRGAPDTGIVWSRLAGDFTSQQLVSAAPDGSGLIELTHPGKHLYDIDAQISPDGSQVIYERDVGQKTSQIHVAAADGTGERSLDLGCVDPCLADLTPTWVPAGDRFLYTHVLLPLDAPHHSAHSAVLWSASFPGGSDIQRFSPPGIDGVLEDYRAHYSPDGSYVAFTRLRNKPFGIAQFRMNVDGSDLQQLTPWKLQGDTSDLSPATSGPTKDLVVFETYGHETPEGESSNVATVPSTCSSLSDCKHRIEYLTNYHDGVNSAFNPSWSPDGTRIAYAKFKGDENDCCVGDIYTMDANGKRREAVSKSPRFEFRPDWGVAP